MRLKGLHTGVGVIWERVPFVSPAAESVFSFYFPAISSSLLPDLSQIYILEAFETRFAGLIGFLLLLINNLGWFHEVDALCCILTRCFWWNGGVQSSVSGLCTDTFVKVHGDFWRLLPGRLFHGGDAPCWSMLGDRDMGSFLLGLGDFDAFWCRSISFGSFLAIKASFPDWCGGSDEWRLSCSLSCLISSRVLFWFEPLLFGLLCFCFAYVLGPIVLGLSLLWY